MPAFNFKEQFAEDVELGIKRQTVRARRRDGRLQAKRGDQVKLYTGMRTKNCRLIAEATIIRVDEVRIESTSMSINGRPLPSHIYERDQLEQTDNEFARADGFVDFMQMADWFEKQHGLPFDGLVYYWDEPR